jgi:hypothetical protein
VSFALFIDVMGVQQALVGGRPRSSESRIRFERCRAHLVRFHDDLAGALEQVGIVSMSVDSMQAPRFVAEFSDSAYIVDDHLAPVALAGILMMRRALRHQYPLRGGIGAGTFSHETSGVRTGRDQTIWSTSSFLGGAIVTAYQAESSTVPGMRIFLHKIVMLRNTEPFLKPYSLPLGTEGDAVTGHELRFWKADEAGMAQERLSKFRQHQRLSTRADRHYGPTIAAYGRFALDRRELPLVGPALWLRRDEGEPDVES